MLIEVRMLQVLMDGLSMELSGSQGVARPNFLTSVQERTWNFQSCVTNLLVQKLGGYETSTLGWTLDSIID